MILEVFIQISPLRVPDLVYNTQKGNFEYKYPLSLKVIQVTLISKEWTGTLLYLQSFFFFLDPKFV